MRKYCIQQTRLTKHLTFDSTRPGEYSVSIIWMMHSNVVGHNIIYNKVRMENYGNGYLLI